MLDSGGGNTESESFPPCCCLLLLECWCFKSPLQSHHSVIASYVSGGDSGYSKRRGIGGRHSSGGDGSGSEGRDGPIANRGNNLSGPVKIKQERHISTDREARSTIFKSNHRTSTRLHVSYALVLPVSFRLSVTSLGNRVMFLLVLAGLSVSFSVCEHNISLQI